jgi:hypothetical protein
MIEWATAADLKHRRCLNLELAKNIFSTKTLQEATIPLIR